MSAAGSLKAEAMCGDSQSEVFPTTPGVVGEISQSNDTPTLQRTPEGEANRIAPSNTPGRYKSPLPTLVHSPGLDLLSPNDDASERAKARAALAARRRRSFGKEKERLDTDASSSQANVDIISNEDLQAMVQNCLHLSAANKINQGNTWTLDLINHMSELIRNDTKINEQTNFQLASCTLETGVKIYSCRVDSVHSEAYKLLGGLGRAAHQEATTEMPTEASENEGLNPKHPSTSHRKVESTLESIQALNQKKVDGVSFGAGPLFHQQSGLFDEGGAGRLLLVNLGVYVPCDILFFSLDENHLTLKVKAAEAIGGSDTLDYTPLTEDSDCMNCNLRQVPAFTPTLNDVNNLLDDPHRVATEAEIAQGGAAICASDLSTPSRSWGDTPQYSDPGEVFDEDDGGHDVCNTGGSNGTFPGSWTQSENGIAEDQEDMEEEEDEDDIFGSQTPWEWLAMVSSLPTKSNAWAGPDHWKFVKPKEVMEISEPAKKILQKKKKLLSFDFNNLAEIDVSRFKPRKDKRLTVLPQSTKECSTMLPPDYHYEVMSLKIFLQPSLSIFSRRSRKRTEWGTSTGCFQDICNEAMWGEGDEPSGEWGDGTSQSGIEDPAVFDLVLEPRKVQQIQIQYDKTVKIVDVRLLKVTLWEQLQDGPGANDEEGNDKDSGLSFQQILTHFPEDCPAASPEEISVHLCFICLLHLANEHSLRIDGFSSMDDLRIYHTIEGGRSSLSV